MKDPAQVAHLKRLQDWYSEWQEANLEPVLSEWQRALAGFLGDSRNGVMRPVARDVAGLVFQQDATLPPEAYIVRESAGALTIRASGLSGIVYGTFAALTAIQRGQAIEGLKIASSPSVELRMLNHWDNPVEDPVMGSIERVKGGKTIFDWTDLSRPNPRYRDYARLLASVGINGLCINNVNATAEVLSDAMLSGLSALAAVFRPWGIRLWLSVDFASPVELDNLPTADPLDERVQLWWRQKAQHIYRLIRRLWVDLSSRQTVKDVRAQVIMGAAMWRGPIASLRHWHLMAAFCFGGPLFMDAIYPGERPMSALRRSG
ncbi:MAG: hypothetical protein LR015_08250 [Verrucomicrobia bacterium]|nr:hypothetical protein [Verrucomicrobiota bacterium]